MYINCNQNIDILTIAYFGVRVDARSIDRVTATRDGDTRRRARRPAVAIPAQFTRRRQIGRRSHLLRTRAGALVLSNCQFERIIDS